MPISFDSTKAVKGVGVDCTKISRFTDMKDDIRDKLAERILSSMEMPTYTNDKNKPKRLACYFAQKEAVAKALGTGFHDFAFSDIIIMKDDYGRPYVMLDKNAVEVAQRKGISSIKLSLTHEGDYIICFAVAE